MKPKLLVTRKVFPEVIEALSAVFDVDHNLADDAWTPEELRRRAGVCRALYVVASDRVDAALLDACPALVMIATGSVGYNHIDLDACSARGVLVTNTPDVLTEATADMGWALLMAAARRICVSERWLRAGHTKATGRPCTGCALAAHGLRTSCAPGCAQFARIVGAKDCLEGCAPCLLSLRHAVPNAAGGWGRA